MLGKARLALFVGFVFTTRLSKVRVLRIDAVESTTAHTIPDPVAANARIAASAFTVATERSTKALTLKSGQIL